MQWSAKPRKQKEMKTASESCRWRHGEKADNSKLHFPANDGVPAGTASVTTQDLEVAGIFVIRCVLFQSETVFDKRFDANVRHDDAVVQNNVLATGVRPDVTGLEVALELVVEFPEQLEARRDFIDVHVAEFHVNIGFAGVIVRFDVGERGIQVRLEGDIVVQPQVVSGLQAESCQIPVEGVVPQRFGGLVVGYGDVSGQTGEEIAFVGENAATEIGDIRSAGFNVVLKSRKVWTGFFAGIIFSVCSSWLLRPVLPVSFSGNAGFSVS